MSAMEIETLHGDWYETDGQHGGNLIPAWLVSPPSGDAYALPDDGLSADLDDDTGVPADFGARWRRALGYYVEGGPDSIDSVALIRDRWGARESMPGYMDCTPWVLAPAGTRSERAAIREYRSVMQLD